MFAVRRRAKLGREFGDIERDLIARGLSPEAAEEAVRWLAEVFEEVKSELDRTAIFSALGYGVHISYPLSFNPYNNVVRLVNVKMSNKEPEGAVKAVKKTLAAIMERVCWRYSCRYEIASESRPHYRELSIAVFLPTI